MLERAERLQRQFFQLGVEARHRPGWQPPVDMFETAQDLWIFVALPGVPAETCEVMIESGILVVSGERSIPTELRRSAVHRLEIPHGRFERRVELPAGRYELGRHELVNGCLVLNLRKLF